jgi:undecaprenyl-diphosphatase
VALQRWTTLVLGLLVPLSVFAFVTVQVERGNGVPHWDRSLLRTAYAHEHDGGLWRLANAWSAPASVPIVAAILVAVALLFLLLRSPRRLAFVLVAAASVLLLEAGLKRAIQRPALFHGAASFSYPSGHAMLAVAIVASTAYALPRTVARIATAIVGGAWAAMVGVASVVHHAHYPSDIVGGWAIGLAWVTALWLLVRRSVR